MGGGDHIEVIVRRQHMILYNASVLVILKMSYFLQSDSISGVKMTVHNSQGKTAAVLSDCIAQDKSLFYRAVNAYDKYMWWHAKNQGQAGQWVIIQILA